MRKKKLLPKNGKKTREILFAQRIKINDLQKIAYRFAILLVGILILFSLISLNIKTASEKGNELTTIVGRQFITDTYLLPINSPITPINGQVRADIRSVDKQISPKSAIYAKIDGGVLSYIKSVFGDDFSPVLLNVINCESGWRTDVVSRTNDVGLWQINLAAHWNKIKGETRAEKIEALKDWRYNTQIAYQIFKTSGLRAWTCYGLVLKTK